MQTTAEPAQPAEPDTRDQLRDFIAQQLDYHATHIACARMFLDISDDAGLFYTMDAAKAHFLAARKTMAEIRRRNLADFQAKEREREATEAASKAVPASAKGPKS